jgi:hypothetical protein
MTIAKKVEEEKSKCCGAKAKDHLSISHPNATDEELRGRTNYYICSECGESCDIKS